MTPDTVILTMTAIAAVAMFVAYHFAMQANYYRQEANRQADVIGVFQSKKPVHGADGKFAKRGAA